jgi:hypothetical protein
MIPIPALILKSATMKLKTSCGEMRIRIRVMMDLQNALCFLCSISASYDDGFAGNVAKGYFSAF